MAKTHEEILAEVEYHQALITELRKQLPNQPRNSPGSSPRPSAAKSGTRDGAGWIGTPRGRRQRTRPRRQGNRLQDLHPAPDHRHRGRPVSLTLARFEADGTLACGAGGERETPFLECHARGSEHGPGR